MQSRLITRLAVVAIAFALALHVHGVYARSAGTPHPDEVEYLHAAWLLANGGVLYETFFEHHSPFIFAALRPLAPPESGADALPFFRRARWLCGAAGLVALLAFAAVVWRIAPEAAAIAVPLVVASSRLWSRAFAEVRGEPLGLAFFWSGVALATSSRPRLAGAGIGLLVMSALWNPKWPISTAAVALFWLMRYWRNAASLVVAALTTACAFLLLSLLVPLDVWWFFNVDVNAALGHAARQSGALMTGLANAPWLYVPAAFRPAVALAAGVVALAAFAIDRRRERLLPIALLVAAAAEIRFVLPYPVIWIHYYAMWGLAAAALVGMVPSSLRLLLGRWAAAQRVAALAAAITAVTLMTLAVAHALAVAPQGRQLRAPYWSSQHYLRSRLGGSATVWLEPYRHPITVRDAHYYWFLAGQIVPVARELRRTERGARYLPSADDLPPCDPPATLRFTMSPDQLSALPRERQCTEQLVGRGRARPTVFRGVYELPGR